MVLDVGFQVSMAKLFVIILDTFNETRAATATIQSVAFGVNQGSGIFTGALVYKFGPRNAGLLGSMLILIGFTSSFLATSVVYLVFSIGVCFALGLSLVYISCNTAVGKCFDGKSNLIALSVLATGSGVGGMMYPYLIDGLSEHYGLRGILLIIGGVTSHGMAFSFMCGQITTSQKPTKENCDTHFHSPNAVSTNAKDDGIIKSYALNTIYGNKNIKENNKSKELNKNDTKMGTSFVETLQANSENNGHSTLQSMGILFRNKCFISFCIGMAFVLPAITYYSIFFVDIYIDKGFTTADASFGMIMFNILSNVGRLLLGLFTRLTCIPPLSLPIIATTICIIGSLSLIFVNNFTTTIFVSCVIGLAVGMLRTGLSVTTVALVGKRHISNGIGIFFTINCVPNVAVGPISGWLRDMSGSYSVVFIAAAVMMGVGLLILILAQYFHSQNIKSKINAMPVFYTTKL